SFPPVQLQLVNGEIYEEKGKIETITGQVDPSTGTVGFRAVFPNPNRILSNGNSGNILIPKTYEDIAVVPEASTFEQQGKVHVYVVQGDTVAISKVIEVRDRVNNLIVVAWGVERGDKIIARGVGPLRNGTPVQPQRVYFDSITKSIKPVCNHIRDVKNLYRETCIIYSCFHSYIDPGGSGPLDSSRYPVS